MTAREAFEQMRNSPILTTGRVVDESGVVGVISRAQIEQAMAKGEENKTVGRFPRWTGVSARPRGPSAARGARTHGRREAGCVTCCKPGEHSPIDRGRRLSGCSQFVWSEASRVFRSRQLVTRSHHATDEEVRFQGNSAAPVLLPLDGHVTPNRSNNPRNTRLLLHFSSNRVYRRRGLLLENAP